MQKPLCLAILFYMVCNALYAQSSIRGSIYDATTNQPIPGVTISSNNEKSNTISDKKGNFLLPVNSIKDSIHLRAVDYAKKDFPASKAESLILMTPNFANLNEIVVTAGRQLQRRTEVPVAINVISKSTINDTKATRLDMLLNKVPGVYMVDLGNEQHSMAVRQPIGTKNLFLYLEDGIPIRTVGDFNHNALIEINQAAVERIEVIKGPASSLYGSEAVGGAINFITQKPSAFLTGKLQVEAGSRGYKRTDFALSNTHKKLGFYMGGYYANQHQSVEDHNDFDKIALTGRVDYHINENLNLSTVADYLAYHTDQKGGLDSAHFYNKDYQSFYRFTYRKVNAFRLRSTLSKDWNNNNQSSITFYYRNSAIGQNPFYSISNIASNPLKAKGQINQDAFRSFGSVMQHITKLESIRSKIISGISADYSPATYFARFIDIDRDANKVYYSYTEKDSMLTNYKVDLLNTAAYTQLEFQATPRLKAVAAARYDRLDYKFDNLLPITSFSGAPDATDHFDHFTPKLGLTYDFGKNNSAYVNYSVGFSPPNITDLYTGTKKPTLKAASYNNYEIGGWISFAENKGSVEASLYNLEGTNEIVSVRLDNGTYQNQNVGKTSHKGVETSLKYAPLQDINFRISASNSVHRYISYIDQGKVYSGHKMAQAPNWIYNSEISYKPHYLKGLRLAIEMQGMSKYFTDPQNTATYKGFMVFNTRLGYSFKGFEMWTNCLNITNKTFATTVDKNAYGTSYRPGQLRTINLGLAYHFNHH